MKNVIIAVLLITALGLGALVFKEKQKKTEAEATIATLRENVADAEARLEEQQKQTSKLHNNLVESRTETVVRSSEVAHLKEALTNETQAAASASASNSANPMANMFK